MSRRNQTPWTPPADERSTWPDESGNMVNGHGESVARRPTPIFWHRPEREAFGEYQTRVVGRFNSVPAFRDAYANGDRGPRRPDPIAAARAAGTPAEWTERLKRFALDHEADLVGVTALDPLWIYEGYDVPSHPHVVVFGIVMDHAQLSQAPATEEKPAGALEVAVQYNRGARVAMNVANWIRAQGYDATPHQGPWAGSLSMLPAALACGFGELGKHGSIINRTYGSSFRLAAVTTDMPLAGDAPDAFGADDFCVNCQVCADACPPDAIFRTKQTVRGETKWYVDFDKCIPYFNETFGCGICIAVCPWSTPGRAPKLATRWTERQATRAEREARQARERGEHGAARDDGETPKG
jgi:epoxyqueuosine reductase